MNRSGLSEKGGDLDLSHSRPERIRVEYGNEVPRIFTPPLRDLTPETSLGFEAIEFAESVVGIKLNPWQKWFLVHALELNTEGNFRYRTILLLVGRQNGKTTVIQLMILWRLYIDRARLVIGTAQNLDLAKETWQATVDVAQEIPELAEEVKKVSHANGQIQLKLTSGGRYKIQAANRKGGRSLSSDMNLLDELREHSTWDAWGAISKTTMARVNGQNVCVSNAGDRSSVVLAHLRKIAHAPLGDPDGLYKEDETKPEGDPSLGIFEWSAAPGCDIFDEQAWAAANPSMGYTNSRDAIAAAATSDPEDIFRTEVLCQWVEYAAHSPFADGVWEAGIDPESHIPADNRFVFCVDVSHDRSKAHIAVAGFRQDGNIHIEVVASRDGTAWVTQWLAKRADHPLLIGVVVQSNGAPVSSLLGDLQELECEVIEWSGSELGRGTGAFYDLVAAGPSARVASVQEQRPRFLTHRQQPVLDVAAAVAVKKRMGDAFVWDRQASPADIAPLVACTGAVWALLGYRPEEPSVYETRRLAVV